MAFVGLVEFVVRVTDGAPVSEVTVLLAGALPLPAESNPAFCPMLTVTGPLAAGATLKV